MLCMLKAWRCGSILGGMLLAMTKLHFVSTSVMLLVTLHEIDAILQVNLDLFLHYCI